MIPYASIHLAPKQLLRGIRDSIDSEQVRSKMAYDEAEVGGNQFTYFPPLSVRGGSGAQLLIKWDVLVCNYRPIAIIEMVVILVVLK